MNEINTYRDEMTLKFILGTESLDNFDSDAVSAAAVAATLILWRRTRRRGPATAA